MLSLGVKTWSKASTKSVSPERQESFSDSRARRQGSRRLPPRRQGSWRLASGLHKTSFFTFQKPRGLSPLAQIKCFRTQTFRETSGTPYGEFRNPSGVQTTLSHIFKIHLRTIPEFLVMSMIISGTPNNIRSPTYITHIILYRQRNVKRADPTGSRTM